MSHCDASLPTHPIKGQYPGHVITLDQSDASLQPARVNSCVLTSVGRVAPGRRLIGRLLSMLLCNWSELVSVAPPPRPGHKERRRYFTGISRARWKLKSRPFVNHAPVSGKGRRFWVYVWVYVAIFHIYFVIKCCVLWGAGTPGKLIPTSCCVTQAQHYRHITGCVGVMHCTA